MTQGKYTKYVNELVPNDDISNKAHTGKITRVLEFDKRFFEGATHHIESFIIYAPGAGFHDGSITGTIIADGKKLQNLPMKLPFDEISLFIGTDPQDPTDLGGEAECWLGGGEEAEKYIITKSSCVFFPAGLVHLPIYFRRVDRPFIFIVIIPTPEPPSLYTEYTEKLPPGFSIDK